MAIWQRSVSTNVLKWVTAICRRPFYINLYLDLSCFKRCAASSSQRRRPPCSASIDLSPNKQLWCLTTYTKHFLACRVCLRMFQALCCWVLGLNCEMRIERAGFGENKRENKQNPNVVNMIPLHLRVNIYSLKFNCPFHCVVVTRSWHVNGISVETDKRLFCLLQLIL